MKAEDLCPRLPNRVKITFEDNSEFTYAISDEVVDEIFEVVGKWGQYMPIGAHKLPHYDPNPMHMVERIKILSVEGTIIRLANGTVIDNLEYVEQFDPVPGGYYLINSTGKPGYRPPDDD